MALATSDPNGTEPGVLTKTRVSRWISSLLVLSAGVAAAAGFFGAAHGLAWTHFDWNLAAVAGTAIGTVLLAGFTGALAWTTSGDVRATWELARLTREDQVSRERPLVLVSISSYIAGRAEAGAWGDSERGKVIVTVVNAGSGPALDLRIAGRTSRGEAIPTTGLPHLQPGYDQPGLGLDVVVDRAALPDPNGPATITLWGSYTDRRMSERYPIQWTRPNGAWLVGEEPSAFGP
jgi:hypothetical protein